MFSSIFGSICNYIITIFIRNFGQLNDVGYFQAANTITNQYIGLVFTAMSLDYFPRLSAVSSDNNQIREIVNRQSELVILILTPLAIALIIFAPLIIKILLTDEFESIIPLLRLFGLGVIFKAISYPLGYISFAKGDKKFFFYLEGIYSNIQTLILNCLFFYYLGIIGLGISFIVSYILYSLIIRFLTGKRYLFRYEENVVKINFISIVLVSVSLAFTFSINGIFSYIIISIILIISLIYSFIELDKRLFILKKK